MRAAAMTALAIGLTVPGLTVKADERPTVAPTRDVAVTYDVTGIDQQAGATRMKVTYADDNQRVRLDFYAFPQAKVPYFSVIYDQPANEVLSLVPVQRAYYKLPATGRRNPGLLLNDDLQYTQQGSATIAGLECTDWQVSNGKDYEGTACVTVDGIALRATRTRPTVGGMEAVAVVYGTPAKEFFQPDVDMRLQPNATPPLPPAPPATK